MTDLPTLTVSFWLAGVALCNCIADPIGVGSGDPDYSDVALPPGVAEVDREAKPTVGIGKETYLRLDGKLVGRRTYDDDLHLLGEERSRDGLRHGLQRTWYPDGKLRSLVTYRDGIPDGPAQARGPAGDILWRADMDRGAGILRTFRSDGRPDTLTPYRGGFPHGIKLSHGPDGSLYAAESYARGRLDGPSRTYYPDGRIEAEQTFRDGRAHGIGRHWTRTGQPANAYGRLEADTPADWRDRDPTPYYYVRGDRVDRAAFDRAAAADPELRRLAELDEAADRVDLARPGRATDPFAPSPLPSLDLPH